ncbi:MAG: NAD(P)H-dependent glycerol-3-phosphate dehydrogenase [Thermodesulfobacteriota bacterium]
MKEELQEIGVIGAGSWGTTLANLLALKGHKVILWVRRPELCRSIQEKQENADYLPGIKLSHNIIPTISLKDSVKDVTVLALPSHGLRKISEEITHCVSDNTTLVSTIKGIEEDTLFTVSQLLTDVFHDQRLPDFAVLSGPSFAAEVTKKLPTAICVSSEKEDVAEKVQQLFNTPYFRVYTNLDVIGVELGGALKNVLAIATGICDGLSLGENSRAALITRGLTEMIRLGMKMGAKIETFSGLSGLGDLILTCTGTSSRNHTVGFRLGKGEKLDEILSTMNMVAEGVRTAKAIHSLTKKYNLEMPICGQVYSILYENKSPKTAVLELMTRGLKGEMDEI